jgi:glycosyltransferase involved in cell wall biosynthesis
MEDSPLVSVCLITYNHSKYVTQAIESILLQKVDFAWEFIIADDNSSDGTREIIAEFRDRRPDLIRLIQQEKNIGPSKNWHQLVGAARGKYIAYLEGDDYWSDCYKLAKQVDFLEANAEYVGCFHNSEERYESGGKASWLYCNFSEEGAVSFADLTGGNFIPSCSMVYRTGLFEEFPEWYYKLKMGDWPLHLLNAQFGDYWYIPKVMGVHRLHKESTWMLQNQVSNNQHVIDAYDIMITGFSHNQSYVEELKKGREYFIRSITAGTKEQKVGYKKKVKNLIIRVIEKF